MLKEITRKLNNTSSSTMPQYFGVLFSFCFHFLILFRMNVWNKRNVYDFMDFYFDILVVNMTGIVIYLPAHNNNT